MKSRISTLLAACLWSFAVLAQANPSASTSAAAANTASISDLAPPAHPATEAQIREYLATTHAIELAHRVMKESLRTARATSAPYFTPGFWDDMESAVLQIDLAQYFIPAYQKYFSEEDMAATIAFYKTPAGQHLLAAQPFIESAAQETLAKAGRDAGVAVGKKHAEEIDRLMKQQQASPAPAGAK